MCSVSRSSEAAERQEGHRGASVWGLNKTASSRTSIAEAVPRRERYTQKGHSPASAVSENCWDKCVLPLEWVRELVPTTERCPDLSLQPTRTSPLAC